MTSSALYKNAANSDLTRERAKAYEAAASSPEGKKALSGATPQEWALRAAGGVGGGLLAWLVGKTLFKKNKTLRVLMGLLGVAGGAGGADYLMKHVPGAEGTSLSYSDVLRLRRGLPELLEQVTKLEEKGAGQPDTPFQRARREWAEEPGFFNSRNTLGGLGAGGGALYGLWKGRTPFWNMRPGEIERLSNNLTAGKNNTAAGKILADIVNGTSKTKVNGKKVTDLLRHDRGQLAIKYDASGRPVLTSRPRLRDRATAGAINAAALAAAGYASGALADWIAGPEYTPGALLSGAKAQWAGR